LGLKSNVFENNKNIKLLDKNVRRVVSMKLIDGNADDLIPYMAKLLRNINSNRDSMPLDVVREYKTKDNYNTICTTKGKRVFKCYWCNNYNLCNLFMGLKPMKE